MFRFAGLKNLGLFLVISLLLVTCTKDLSLDYSQGEPKLIINSEFQANDVFKVELTTSRNILDPDSKIEGVSDAYVAIKDDKGKILEVLTEYKNTGIYVSTESTKAYQSATFHLEVTHPRWKGIVYTATSSAPPISNSSTIDTSYVIIKNNPALKVDVMVDDLQDLNDQYMFEILLVDDKLLAPLMLNSNGDQDIDIFGNKDEPKRLFLDDANFNGLQRNVDFFTKSGIPSVGSTGSKKTEIRMLSVSPEYYKYYKSLEQYELAQKTINSGNSAVPIYSNIKESGQNTGLGIFAGYNLKKLEYSY